MSEPKIRPMAAADLKVVVAIADSLATAPHWPRSAYEAALDPAGVPPRIALVAEVSGIIAGLAIASLIPPQAELETIAISQPFKRDTTRIRVKTRSRCALYYLWLQNKLTWRK